MESTVILCYDNFSYFVRTYYDNMPATNLNRLKRKQLDTHLQPYAKPLAEAPRGGWLKTIRTALGMTLAQLAQRTGRARQSIDRLERNEVDGSITLAKLKSVANALGCDVMIGLRPRAGTLEATVRQQAIRKARGLHSSVYHTMELEAQTAGLKDNPDEEVDVQWWLNENAKRLWD